MPKKVCTKYGPTRFSLWQILLPSAVHLKKRLTVSQSVSQSGKQSVRQSVGQAGRQTETHSLGFFSGRLGIKQWGEQILPEQAMVERPVWSAQSGPGSNLAEHKLLSTNF